MRRLRTISKREPSRCLPHDRFCLSGRPKFRSLLRLSPIYPRILRRVAFFLIGAATWLFPLAFLDDPAPLPLREFQRFFGEWAHNAVSKKSLKGLEFQHPCFRLWAKN